MYEFLAGLFKWILASLGYFFLFHTIQVIRLTGWYGEKANAYLIANDESKIKYELKGNNVIGRGQGCDIVLNNQFVSLRHAVITKNWQGYYIEDLKSSNGTMVNRRFIKKRKKLKDGDIITIGPIKLTYRS